MRLTTYTDYSLRVLIYLGVQSDKLVTIKQISDHYGISNNHLLKVVHQLGLLGFIETVRDITAGCGWPARLSDHHRRRRAENGAGHGPGPLLRTEGRIDPGSDCKIMDACVLKGALSKALQAFLDVLDQYTLAELVAPREPSGGTAAGRTGLK